MAQKELLELKRKHDEERMKLAVEKQQLSFMKKKHSHGDLELSTTSPTPQACALDVTRRVSLEYWMLNLTTILKSISTRIIIERSCCYVRQITTSIGYQWMYLQIVFSITTQKLMLNAHHFLGQHSLVWG